MYLIRILSLNLIVEDNHAAVFNMERVLFLIIACFLFVHSGKVSAQANFLKEMVFPLPSGKITKIDLDGDGDPDVLRTLINDSIPVQWIDDDDDMKAEDFMGDLDSDCLMIDRNRDGKYGDELDLIIDWCDENKDGKADLELIADNAQRGKEYLDAGHFMISVDTDNDGVLNHINWRTLRLEAWEHRGQSGFFEDYSGESMFMKVHTSTFNIDDLRFNWENPFLFYDPDNDGLSEMAIRLMDEFETDTSKSQSIAMARRISDVRISFDIDNDNGPGNEFDFDMSLRFAGQGFDYSNFVHEYQSLRGLPDADTFFLDSRWRQMNELIYVGHDDACKTVFEKGKWSSCWLVFDEDDDCQRWERVEFYEPKDVFAIGVRNGGLDNNPQADASGDRGEWDMDNSGRGKLYVGHDGLIHLFGAEWGAWRIDLYARYFQGWQGWRNGADKIPNDGFIDEPLSFPTIHFSDTDNNGFFDFIEYDFDEDKVFEKKISFHELGINDQMKLYDPQYMNYTDFQLLFEEVCGRQWSKAVSAIQIAQKFGININRYSLFLNPLSQYDKYYFGYWINYLVYSDLQSLKHVFNAPGNSDLVDQAYFSGNWDLLKTWNNAKHKNP